MQLADSTQAKNPDNRPDAPETSNGATRPAASGYAVAPAIDVRWSDALADWADRWRRWVFVGIALVYLAGFNAQWRLEPDSALYLSVGRNLADGQGYTFLGKHQRLAYPGLPLLFAGTFKTLHTRSPALLLGLMLLMGFAALGLTYRLFLLAAGRPTAVVVTAGVAMSRIFYRYNFELLNDLPFLMGVMAFLVGYEAVFHADARQRTGQSPARRGTGRLRQARIADDGDLPPARSRRRRWFDWALLAAGMAVAIAMRPAMWALVFAVIAAPLWSLLMHLMRRDSSRTSVRWGQLLVCLVVIAGVALFYLRDPRHAERLPVVSPGAPQATTPGYAEEDEMFNPRPDRLLTMARRMGPNAPRVADALTKASFGMQMEGIAQWPLSGVMLVLGLGLVFLRPLWGMFVLMTVLMVLVVPEPLDRYFLALAPLLVFAWWRFCVWMNHRLAPKMANVAFSLLFLLGAAPNGAKVFDFIREQRQTPFLAYYKNGRFASIAEAAKMIRDYTPPSLGANAPRTTWVLVAPKFGRILSYLSGRYATEPERSTALDASRVSLYVLEPSDAPARRKGEEHYSVHQWIEQRHLREARVPVAQTPNKDPNAQEPWSLHRVRPKP